MRAVVVTYTGVACLLYAAVVEPLRMSAAELADPLHARAAVPFLSLVFIGYALVALGARMAKPRA
jgi:hypothetical protein